MLFLRLQGAQELDFLRSWSGAILASSFTESDSQHRYLVCKWKCSTLVNLQPSGARLYWDIQTCCGILHVPTWCSKWILSCWSSVVGSASCGAKEV